MKSWRRHGSGIHRAPDHFSDAVQADAVTPRLVGFLGFDGVASCDLTGPLEAFAAARIPAERGGTLPCYETIIIGVGAQTFVSESGVTLKADATILDAPVVDTLVIPGGSGLRKPDAGKVLSEWLKTRAADTRRMAAISTGIYGLASTDLLTGRQVTTHWRFAKHVAETFPQVRMNYTASFLQDGPFYTCGGGAAGIELALDLIRDDYGVQVALAVAREFVIELRPSGDDEQLVAIPPDYQSGPTERLAELPAWISNHLRENLSVEVLADRSCLCPRHFSRLFKKVFNSTPADLVEQLRLSEARRRLLLPGNSVEGVSASVGFKSADAFRRAFERRLGMTPSNFRNRFEFRVEDTTTGVGASRTSVVARRKVRFH